MKKRSIVFLMILGSLVWVSCSKMNPLNEASQQVETSKSDKGQNGNTTPAPVDGPEKPKAPMDGDNPPPQEPSGCDLVFCTTDFVELFLEVVDKNGTPLLLDSYHTEDMRGNKLSADLYNYNQVRGAYVVFNDSWVNNHRNSSTSVKFVGVKNGNVVVQEVYSIQTDCCHISKTSGKDRIVIP